MKSLFALLLLTFFGSCSIEKRRYNSGYHIEWFTKEKPASAERSIPILPSVKINAVIAPDQPLKLTKKFYELAFRKELTDQQRFVNDNVELTERTDTIPRMNLEEDGPPRTYGAGGIIMGIILQLGGIALAIFAVPVFGICIAGIGIIVLIAGINGLVRSANKRRDYFEKQKQPKEIEVKSNVVYLKNGSMIRGTITEMIPNESIKIETADGSIFVYEMKDVLKITNELRK